MEDPRIEQLLTTIALIDNCLGIVEKQLDSDYKEYVGNVRKIIADILVISVELPKDIKS